MKLSSGVPFALAIAATFAAGATQALAQATEPRGSGGLFGGGNSDASARQRLDLTLSSTGAYDTDMVPKVGAAVGSGGPESTGYSTMLTGAADYAWQGRRVQVRANGASTLHYNRPLDDILYSSRSVSHTAGVGVSARLPKRTTVLVNQTATYSPSSLYNLFPRPPATLPGDAPPAAPDYAMSGFESHSYGTAMTLAHDFTRRSSLSATADYQNTDTLGGIAGRRALSSYGIRTHLSHRLAANTAAMAEYVYRTSEGRGGEATTGEALADHGVNIGVNYNRRLSATRSVTFGAVVGSSTMIVPKSAGPDTAVPEPAVPESAVPEPAVPESTVPESAVPASAEGLAFGDQHYRQMSGQVTMGYGFARTWNAGAIYRRGVDYVAGLSEPTSADSFTANLNGLLTRRMDVLVSAGYSRGESALNRQSSIFETYTGNVRLGYALTRMFAAYVEYLYYFYDSRGSTPIAPGIPSGLERKGVRTGLTLRVPALRR